MAGVASPIALPLPGDESGLEAPQNRSLRVFAFDPILGMRIDTETINETTLEIPWEEVQPGPIGEYIEVVDVDPASEACYAPVNLNHKYILAEDGLDPAEGNPQFHQQMVYAVAMTTIGRFEDALGRKAIWAPAVQSAEADEEERSYYVQRLRIYPHALREQNSYYSPDKKSLLFGYFQANPERAGDNLPGGLVFCCLSHDVVAHETTHALLDGLHPYYQYETNDDIAAFHEAFADIVALFQHFTIPEALKETIAESQGDLAKDNLLAELAQQFGQASDGSKALRSALGKKAEATDYATATEAHDRGAVLLAAIFDAFLQIYGARIADLKRLVTNGTGILPPGDISVDLVNRMAREASVAADHVLKTCIRALDYCPPVDLTFGDYLRALITADMDLEPEDELNYRTAFISAFRTRGIYPKGARQMSEKNLRWQPPGLKMEPEKLGKLLDQMDLNWSLATDRRSAYTRSKTNGTVLLEWLGKNLEPSQWDDLENDLGVYLRPGNKQAPPGLKLAKDGKPILRVHSVRPARRINRRGQQQVDLVIEAVQWFSAVEDGVETLHRGGCTLLIDMDKQRFRYAVRKRVGSASRLKTEQDFLRMAAGSGSYFDRKGNKEPFAMLHRGV